MDNETKCFWIVVVGIAVWAFTFMVCESIKGLADIKVSNSDRYELKQLGSMAKNSYLTDKETGRVWQIVVDPKTDVNWLMELHVQNLHNPNEDESED